MLSQKDSAAKNHASFLDNCTFIERCYYNIYLLKSMKTSHHVISSTPAWENETRSVGASSKRCP